MNANEQFDFYNPDSMYYANSKHYIAQLEAMSRQQQAEIEALKNILSEIDRQVFNIELRDDGTMTPVIRMEKP